MGLTGMEETHKRRCGNCGAEIQARHLGSVKIGDSDVAIGYCERCNAFGVPIGEDEKTYRERMADAKLRVPKGWSMRQCEDGSLELRRGVPCCWLLVFPVGFAVFVASILVAGHFMNIGDMDLRWSVFIAVFAAAVAGFFGLVALGRLTARRYRLGMEALVAESLWLGFIPVCRRMFARTAITSGIIQECGKDYVAVWSNGYDLRVFWRGRSKNEAEFIEANLLVTCESALDEEPLLCGKCGMPFRSKDIDMQSNSLLCPRCSTATEPGSADWVRLVRFRMRYRPHGVVDIPVGFELREGRWWNGALNAALSRYVVVICIAAALLGPFEKLSEPWVCIPISILLLVFAAAPVYLVASAIVGRFGVHRVTAQNGHLAYFHGIGRFGRHVDLPKASVDGFGVMYRGSFFDSNAAFPKAIGIGVKDEKEMKHIFRDCSPVFYHWVEGWLYNVLKTSTEATK